MRYAYALEEMSGYFKENITVTHTESSSEYADCRN